MCFRGHGVSAEAYDRGMLPWSLFPIPGPSPTADRIVVELNNASSGGPNAWISALVTAAIAGFVSLVVTRLTHGYAERRESSSWLRERLFDISKALAEQQRIIQAEALNEVDLPEASASDSVAALTYQHYLDRHEWTILNDAVATYEVALDEATLLLRTPKLKNQLDQLRIEVTGTRHVTQTFIPAQLNPFLKVGEAAFEARNTEALNRFLDAHEAFLTLIANDYLLRGEPKRTR